MYKIFTGFLISLLIIGFFTQLGTWALYGTALAFIEAMGVLYLILAMILDWKGLTEETLNNE